MSDNQYFVEQNKNTSQNDEVQQRTDIVIPVIEESVVFDKQWKETGVVTITKQVEEKTETVDASLLSEKYEIEHVAVNRYVDDEIPQARYEGDVLVLPVLKEVIVKRLLLTEEIRITKKTTEQTEQYNMMLRKESVSVTRTPTSGQ